MAMLGLDSEFIKKSLIGVGMTLFAGLATAFGGCIVYFKSLVKLANKTFLSAALGFSAGMSDFTSLMGVGVMLFLSFSEIFIESKDHFLEAIKNEQLAKFYACLSLVCGIAVAYLLEIMLHRSSKVEFELPVRSEKELKREVHTMVELKSMHSIRMVDNELKDVPGEVVMNPIISETANHELSMDIPCTEVIMNLPTSGYEMTSISGCTRDLTKDNFFIQSEREQLKTMGLLSAIAISLHNIPEGIVTYIAYLDDPFVGISLAIGIACHNIPEGLSVALPVYYATKSRNKAFFWSLLSGFAEPLGAILCMLFLQRFMNDSIFGFLFGFTGGIMTYICICELLPTGMQMDCEKNYTMISFIIGMIFIMIPLVLL